MHLELARRCPQRGTVSRVNDSVNRAGMVSLRLNVVPALPSFHDDDASRAPVTWTCRAGTVVDGVVVIGVVVVGVVAVGVAAVGVLVVGVVVVGVVVVVVAMVVVVDATTS